ncbi:MAG: hypothetical protein KKC68_00055 [Candidatus Thermoplasmatota archaeon]|nr:hypothetical protein [Candidatus Thermoplasmatota archaeon]MBU1940144.1 hypothetical protein [Candidatus Thermoplasmatota archaeon]
MVKKSWDYKKFNYRFYHTTINEVTWFLFGENDRYFFSTEEPEKGEPVNLPEGYEVKIDKISRKPILVEKKSIGQAVDDFFAHEPEEKKQKSEKPVKKKRKLPSEMHDRYHRWKY